MENKSFEEVLNENGSLIWKSDGFSMLPLIRTGRDLLVINKKCEPLKKYDVVLFKRPGVVGRGAYVLHRILKVYKDGTYWIVGDNCTSGELVKEENIIGVLSEVIRDNKKKVDQNNFSYQAYILLWCAPYHLRFLILRSKGFISRAIRKIFRM